MQSITLNCPFDATFEAEFLYQYVEQESKEQEIIIEYELLSKALQQNEGLKIKDNGIADEK